MTTSGWVSVGDRCPTRIRVDQIASWRDEYFNGWQHYLTVTLVNGKEIRAEINREQWDEFTKAVGER